MDASTSTGADMYTCEYGGMKAGTSTGADMYTCEYGGMDTGTTTGTGAGASMEAWMQRK